MDMLATFRTLHAGDTVLMLPNAWDAASAALARAAGAQAIATSSAGLAWSCGYADGNALPHDHLLFAVAAICRVAGDIPVSVDFEAGYSAEPAAVAAFVCELRALGVAGINLEDGTDPPELLDSKIQAIKKATDIFINARTDIYLQGLAEGEPAQAMAIERGKRYAQSGADGFFVPALRDRETIRRVAERVALPLNVLAVPGLPFGSLYDLGVRRLSAGSLISKLAFGTAHTAARAFLQAEHVPGLFAQGGVEYGEMNALFR